MVEIIKIKMAGNEDVQLLSDLSIVTFIETYRGSCPDKDILNFVDESFNENVIADEIDNKADFYFIAFADGEPAGYMLLKEEYEGYPFAQKHVAIKIKRLYVTKDYQSKKVGAALMNYALDFAHEKGYDVMWLGVWEHNKKAISFYKKWGFDNTDLTSTFTIGNTKQIDNWLIKSIERS